MSWMISNQATSVVALSIYWRTAWSPLIYLSESQKYMLEDRNTISNIFQQPKALGSPDFRHVRNFLSGTSKKIGFIGWRFHRSANQNEIPTMWIPVGTQLWKFCEKFQFGHPTLNGTWPALPFKSGVCPTVFGMPKRFRAYMNHAAHAEVLTSEVQGGPYANIGCHQMAD